jgi:hypothetical protein
LRVHARDDEAHARRDRGPGVRVDEGALVVDEGGDGADVAPELALDVGDDAAAQLGLGLGLGVLGTLLGLCGLWLVFSP